jgi:lysophospholipase L1-like esterase
VPLDRKPFWSDEIGRAVRDVNAYIATLADEKTIVFDAYALLVDRQGLLLEKYKSNELHLNEAGYVLLNRELVKIIDRIDRQKTRSSPSTRQDAKPHSDSLCQRSECT